MRAATVGPPSPPVLALFVLTLLAAPALATAPPADCPTAEAVAARSAAETPILPPEVPWDGASWNLATKPDAAWATPAEASDLRCSPSYDETVAFLERLVASSPKLHLTSIGQSGEGRELWMVIASDLQVESGVEGENGGHAAPTAADLHADGRAIVLAQAGIHSGEIDGKDAGLMLLRDLAQPGAATETGRAADGLLAKAHFLFVPIFNVDGHERRSPFGRVNQRGPEVMGWRTTARNLNLNRDYAKADAPEMQALLRALGTWRPDLYVDLHVTDGIDYQYDITWGYAGPQTASPSIHRVLSEVVDPPVIERLEAAGHVPGYLVFATDPENPTFLFHWNAAGPRFSDGYGALRHLPTILVENHSLDPYDQRVLGTRILLEGLLDVAGREVEALRAAVAEDRARRPASVPLGWTVDRANPQAEQKAFRGVAWDKVDSPITGQEQIRWLGTPRDETVGSVAPNLPTVSATRPAAYWIPAQWTEVIERLAVHGIEMERIDAPRTIELDYYRVASARLEPDAYEGRARVTFQGEDGTVAAPTVERHRVTLPAGSVRVSTDQPLGDLAMVLLEPESDDSFFRWGFFLEILTQPEYVEAYVMEPMARRMLEDDPELRAAFEARLADDPEFAASPQERLQFFYRRTPFYDARHHLYPVAREPAAQ